MSTNTQYDYNQDFYAWAIHNAELIRQGKFSQIDIENVAEELESMGNSNKRELANRLAVLIAHLLKWQCQPNLRSRSWKLIIREQRICIHRLLKESPSLKYTFDSTLLDAYEQALVIAERESGLDESTFPERCPFNLEQYLSHDFFPE
jgi:hypothetical protein